MLFLLAGLPDLGISGCSVYWAIAAAATLYNITSGKAEFFIDNIQAGVFSPDAYSLEACFIASFVLTLFFLLLILGATDRFTNGKFAGIAIGLGLTLNYLISTSINNISVNPARFFITSFICRRRTTESVLAYVGLRQYQEQQLPVLFTNSFYKLLTKLNNKFILIYLRRA